MQKLFRTAIALGATLALTAPSLAAEVDPRGPDDVPNGIAWDARGKRLFVTGKDWPTLFEIKLPAR